MVSRFVFGNPIKTNAVIKETALADISAVNPLLKFSEDKRSFTIDLLPDDSIYGLGESLHGMNKRGFIYVSNNTDQVHHDENQYSLYGSHNFVLLNRFKGIKLGLFVDYPAKTTFDIGFTDKDVMKVSV